MKHSLFLISALTVMIATAPAYAGNSETHSAYKVTTYNLGALLGGQTETGLSLQNYEPLMITSTKADILTPDPADNGNLKGTSREGNVNGFAIAAEYSPTSKIALHGVLGVTQDVDRYKTLNAETSWEANLGVIYRFFDNLSYQVHFGYMDTGDLLKERSSYSDDESIIMISNKITLSF